MRQGAPLPLAVAFSVALLAFGVALAAPVEPSALVGWPASSGLLIGEVVTGGASGSDEYAELYNASGGAIGLDGLELVYVTATGGTVTRKAAWSVGTLLPAGGHLLVANSSGIYAPLADALYSGGFASTGGSLVLRPIGGSPIDAVGWGDAVNTFVEGAAGPAPPAGQSIERRPGGLDGNGQDTNDNSVDFFVDPAPEAQNLAAPPVPAPGPTSSSTLPPTPLATDTLPPPDATPTPPGPPEPSASPSEQPTDPPTPTAPPTESATPAATPTGSPSATPVPTAATSTIAEARAAPNGTVVDVVGTLTTPAGLVESGTGAFVQDETAGIALYLASAAWPSLEQGALLRVHGTVDDRYSQRTLRIGSGADVTPLGVGAMPLAVDLATGNAGEASEGLLVSVVARVVASADTLSDGFAVTVDDGSGQLRVVASAMTGIGPSDLSSGAWFRLSGALGQRDSSGTGTQGYRLYLRSSSDVEPPPEPSPSPDATPGPSAEPTATPSVGPTPSPSPTPGQTASPTPAPTVSPTPAPTPLPVLAIAAARTLPLDSVVMVEGVVTAEPGRIIDDRTGAIQDVSAGIAVRLPRDGWPAFRRGDVLRVRGTIGQRYGNLELRPATAEAITVIGPGSAPAPRVIVASELGDAIEGLLVRGAGVVVSVDALGASGNFGLDLKDASGTLRVFVYETTGIGRDAFPKGALVEVSGVEGQHAPSTGSTAGHRVWPRDPRDVRLVGAPGPSVGASPAASPGATSSPGAGSGSTPVPIASAIRDGGTATVEGTVTTPAGLIDTDGRHVVIEDASGAVLLRLPSGATAPPVGTRVIASGTIGTYYGSPQLELADPPRATGAGSVAPRILGAPPGAGLAWRLVRVSGLVSSVKRLGSSWRAEVSSGGASFPIYGLARSGVPSTALVEGRIATVTGVVRPPYPTATDRRPAIAPRFSSDVSPRTASGSGSVSATGSGTGGGPGLLLDPAGGAPLDVELAELADHEGVRVRVGGLVASVAAGRIVIDDGTATAAILVPGDGTVVVADLRLEDPLNAVGPVVRDGDAWAVAPRSAADIARVGRLGELAPLVQPTPAARDGSATLAPQELNPHGGWPLGALPTVFALAGTGLTVALRRRNALEFVRKAAAALGSLAGHWRG